MNKRTGTHTTVLRVFLLAALVGVATVSCGPKYHLLRESPRISLRGAHSFVIAPMRFDGHMDNAEQESFEAWYARNHPRQYAAFEQAYRAMPDQTAARLALRTGYSVSTLGSSVAPDAFVITARIVSAHIRETSTTFQGRVDVEATVYTSEGQEVAVITYSTVDIGVGRMFAEPDISPWIHELAIDAGNRLALFLATRTDPAVH